MLFAGILLLLTQACAPAYVPNVINVPMMDESGEIQIAAYGGTSGYDVQTAYALNDHIGFMLNWSYQDTKSDSIINQHYHQFLEFGTGYYNSFADVVRFDVLLDGGLEN